LRQVFDDDVDGAEQQGIRNLAVPFQVKFEHLRCYLQPGCEHIGAANFDRRLRQDLARCFFDRHNFPLAANCALASLQRDGSCRKPHSVEAAGRYFRRLRVATFVLVGLRRRKLAASRHSKSAHPAMFCARKRTK